MALGQGVLYLELFIYFSGYSNGIVWYGNNAIEKWPNVNPKNCSNLIKGVHQVQAVRRQPPFPCHQVDGTCWGIGGNP